MMRMVMFWQLNCSSTQTSLNNISLLWLLRPRAIKDWMDFRFSFGEEITGESWVLRNTWQKVKPRYSHRIGLAKYPRQFKSTGIKTLNNYYPYYSPQAP